MASWDEEIAWAAGFFEGEGSITVHNARPALQIKNNDLETLAHFRHAVEAGKIYGPYRHATRLGNASYWMWIAQGEEALGALALMVPWLTRRRLDQALVTLAKVRGPAEASSDAMYSRIVRVVAQRRTEGGLP